MSHYPGDDGDIPVVEMELGEEFVCYPERERCGKANEETYRDYLVFGADAV